MPDQAAERSSGKETAVACNIRLNLPIREILVLCASASFGDALTGNAGWLIRCNEFAGSRKISLYCGLSIFPSPFLALG